MDKNAWDRMNVNKKLLAMHMPCPTGLTSNGKISLGTIHVRGPHDLPNLAEIIRHGKMGQTRLTRNPINLFKNDPFWPATRFNQRPD